MALPAAALCDGCHFTQMPVSSVRAVFPSRRQAVPGTARVPPWVTVAFPSPSPAPAGRERCAPSQRRGSRTDLQHLASLLSVPSLARRPHAFCDLPDELVKDSAAPLPILTRVLIR